MQKDNKKKVLISVTLIVLIIGFIIYTISDKQGEINLDDLVSIDSENSEVSGALEDSGENNSEGVKAGNDGKNSMNNERNVGENTTGEKIIVHVTGEVKKEGIVYLEKGARIIDAIEEAGGETKEADLSQVNLAYQLQDGQKIYIPNKNERITEYIIDGIGDNSIEENNSSRQAERRIK